MWDVRVPSVVQFPLLLPGVLGGVDLEHASRRRALVRYLSHVTSFLVASDLQRKVEFTAVRCMCACKSRPSKIASSISVT